MELSAKGGRRYIRAIQSEAKDPTMVDGVP